MNQINTSSIKYYLIVFLLSNFTNAYSQSFNDDKISLINYITRVYASSPFEGGKKIEGDFISCAVAIPNKVPSADVLLMAWKAARVAFAEPCVQFENIGTTKANDNKEAQLFICRPLSEFIREKYLAKPFDGAKIIQAPLKNLIVAVITLNDKNYQNSSIRDRAATIKAKSYVNTLTNGSNIYSDIFIQTEIDNKNNPKTVSIETIKELSMGFVGGMSLLTSFASDSSHTTYVFYSEKD